MTAFLRVIKRKPVVGFAKSQAETAEFKNCNKSPI